MSTLWEMGTENLGRYLSEKPPHRYALYEAARFIRCNTDPGAVVMIDPGIEGMDDARRWSDRRGLLPSGSSLGGNVYADPLLLAEVKSACDDVAKRGLGRLQVARLRHFGATVALVRAAELTTDAGEDRILYRNKEFAIVDLVVCQPPL
jgi:hypothetical protein